MRFANKDPVKLAEQNVVWQRKHYGHCVHLVRRKAIKFSNRFTGSEVPTSVSLILAMLLIVFSRIYSMALKRKAKSYKWAIPVQGCSAFCHNICSSTWKGTGAVLRIPVDAGVYTSQWCIHGYMRHFLLYLKYVAIHWAKQPQIRQGTTTERFLASWSKIRELQNKHFLTFIQITETCIQLQLAQTFRKIYQYLETFKNYKINATWNSTKTWCADHAGTHRRPPQSQHT